MDIKGKKLLIIGGSMATYAIVQNAKEMGVYTVVADAVGTGEAFIIADEGVLISTTDIDGLKMYIEENDIDGIFCGPSEFNIQNTISLAEKTGMRFYATKELWHKCGDKTSLKYYCKKCGLPLIPQYSVDSIEEIERIPEKEYPLIVKPVDGCSSKGVTVCRNRVELCDALKEASGVSATGRAFVEKYIDNGGRLFSFRYFLDGENAYPYFLIDTYIADPLNKKSLISAFSIAPSDYAEYYLEHMDHQVRKMLYEMGLRHGVVFAQSLPYDGEFYCHDMGYRLSGGMVYKMTEMLSGINDMKMMIRYALGGEICTAEEIERINLRPNNKYVAQLMMPLNTGKISKIIGIDKITQDKSVIQFIQYYHEGDEIKDTDVGTLGQQFGRVAFCGSSKEEIVDAVNRVLSYVSILDTNNQEMFTMRFDTNRLYVK